MATSIGIRYQPGNDLAGRIRSHEGFKRADMVSVLIPRYSDVTMIQLAMEVEEAEWELGIEIWINGYFQVPRAKSF